MRCVRWCVCRFSGLLAAQLTLQGRQLLSKVGVWVDVRPVVCRVVSCGVEMCKPRDQGLSLALCVPCVSLVVWCRDLVCASCECSPCLHPLQKYNLPHPTAVFELGYFKTNPKPFYTLGRPRLNKHASATYVVDCLSNVVVPLVVPTAKELYPGSFVPTPAHHLVKLLHDKGVLLRVR